MHVLNSAHIGVAFLAALAVLMIGMGVTAIVETIHERRNTSNDNDTQEKP